MKKITALLIGVGLILSAPGPRAANAANTLTRDLDPVVVLGGVMPDFAGVPLAQLFVYKYSGGVWSQIPWQFDEVVGSAIVSSDNGLLDAQDQLVFMAADAGEQAPTRAWLSDASAATFPRYELTVNDPLNPSQHAWVYVYRSQTLCFYHRNRLRELRCDAGSAHQRPLQVGSDDRSPGLQSAGAERQPCGHPGSHQDPRELLFFGLAD